MGGLSINGCSVRSMETSKGDIVGGIVVSSNKKVPGVLVVVCGI
jgi:hypothetical protein